MDAAPLDKRDDLLDKIDDLLGEYKDLSPKNWGKLIVSRKKGVYYCLILIELDLGDLIAKYHPTDKRFNSYHMAAHPCQQMSTSGDCCHNNVKLTFPGIPKSLALYEEVSCRNCIFTCDLCGDKYAMNDMNGTGPGSLYDGMCKYCTSCDNCGQPKWDYVCSCSI